MYNQARQELTNLELVPIFKKLLKFILNPFIFISNPSGTRKRYSKKHVKLPFLFKSEVSFKKVHWNHNLMDMF